MKKKLEKSTQTDYIDMIVDLYFSGYSLEKAFEEVGLYNDKDEVRQCLEKIVMK